MGKKLLFLLDKLDLKKKEESLRFASSLRLLLFAFAHYFERLVWNYNLLY